VASTLARKDFEVSVLLKKVAAMSKERECAQQQCMQLEAHVLRLEAREETVRAECSEELVDAIEEGRLRVGVVEAEVGEWRDKTARLHQELTTYREVQSVRGAEAEVETLRERVKGMEEDIEKQVWEWGGREELVKMQDEWEEVQEVVAQLKFENGQLQMARDELACACEQAVRGAAHEKEECDRACEDSARAVLQLEEQCSILENEGRSAAAALDRECRDTAKLRHQLNGFDMMLAQADAKHGDALHEAAEIEQALDIVAASSSTLHTILIKMQQQQQRQQHSNSRVNCYCVTTSSDTATTAARAEEMCIPAKEPSYMKGDLHGGHMPPDAPAAESELALVRAQLERVQQDAERLRSEVLDLINSRANLESDLSAAHSKARESGRQEENMRGILSSSACCAHVRERLEESEESESQARAGQRELKLKCAQFEEQRTSLQQSLDESQLELAGAREHLQTCQQSVHELEGRVTQLQRDGEVAAQQGLEAQQAQDIARAAAQQRERDGALQVEGLQQTVRQLHASTSKVQAEKTALQTSLDVAQQRILDSALTASKLRLNTAMGCEREGGREDWEACVENEDPNPEAGGELVPRTPRGISAPVC